MNRDDCISGIVNSAIERNIALIEIEKNNGPGRSRGSRRKEGYVSLKRAEDRLTAYARHLMAIECPELLGDPKK